MALAKRKSSSKGRSGTTGKRRLSNGGAHRASRNRVPTRKQFVICVRNDDYRASLELRKLYEIIDDSFAVQHDLLRVVDESGEDYLYPAEYFVHVDLPKAIQRTLQTIA